ncbi:MAG: hypothetical protein KGM47_18965 [Acidobacteriota bacterium]|nr:hypothetical protein [Acidobacteriota bacterium]
MSYQKWATVIIIIAAAIVVGIEYLSVRWYPAHKDREDNAALKLLPYQNSTLEIQMQIASGIYGSVKDFPGGVEIRRSRLFGSGPVLRITTAPNPESASTFDDKLMAKIETAGTMSGDPTYQFERLTLNGRDAYIVSRYDANSKSTNVTEAVMAPDRIIQAVCNTGTHDEDVFTQACNESLKSMNVKGPPSKLPEKMGALD